MQKKNDPSFDGSLKRRFILAFFSNGRSLTSKEYFDLRIAVLTPFSMNEPLSVTKARNRISNAILTLDHFRSEGLEPIFDSFDFEALKLKGIK